MSQAQWGCRTVFRLERAAQMSGVATPPWAGVAAGRPESAWWDEEAGEERQASLEAFGVTRPLLEVDLRSGRGGECPHGEVRLEVGRHRLLSRPGRVGKKRRPAVPHARRELPPRRPAEQERSRGPGLVRGGRPAEAGGLAVVVSRGGCGTARGSVASEWQRPLCLTPRGGGDVLTALENKLNNYVCLSIR